VHLKITLTTDNYCKRIFIVIELRMMWKVLDNCFPSNSCIIDTFNSLQAVKNIKSELVNSRMII